jgi:hypothetical protein
MIKSWLSKVTSQAVIPAAVIALAISPSVGLANPPSKAKGAVTHIVRHPARQAVQFQGKTPAATWEDNDGFYTPPRSPGFHDLFGS